MARKAEQVGVVKAGMSTANAFALSVLAGAFIALGAIFATTVTAGSTGVPFGVVRLVGGLAFSLGLILVVVAGAELFTGNNLIVMAWAGRRVRTAQVVRNWTIVYIGQPHRALATAGDPLRFEAVRIRWRRGGRRGAVDRRVRATVRLCNRWPAGVASRAVRTLAMTRAPATTDATATAPATMVRAPSPAAVGRGAAWAPPGPISCCFAHARTMVSEQAIRIRGVVADDPRKSRKPAWPRTY